jgi:hypothetical protein
MNSTAQDVLSLSQEYMSQMLALRGKVVVAYMKKKKLAKKVVPFTDPLNEEDQDEYI